MNNTDNLISSLKKLGWHLTREAIDDFIKENPNLKQADLIKIVLDTDLRSIGEKFLPDLTTSAKIDTLEGPCVLQLVKVRNIAAPKENETSSSAPPLYRLTLTDGIVTLNGLVIDEPNTKLNLNTPPGTKMLIKGSIRIKSNMLILNNQTCQILGGTVDHLVKKWMTNKELQQHVRVVNLATAPPPWTPFGVRQVNQVDTSKKVFAQNQTQEEDTNSEFSQARQAALAEAMEAKLKITKTFTQQTIDKSQITSADPIPAPTLSISASASSSTRSKGRGGGRGRRGKNLDRDDEDDYRESKDAVKPVAVTLFDMVKSKLSVEETETETQNQIQNNNNDNNQEYGYGGRSGRGRGNRGGRGRGSRGRGQSNQYNSNGNQNSNESSKQVYDRDDFSYDLGDTTKVKDLVKMPKVEEKNSKLQQDPKTLIPPQQQHQPQSNSNITNNSRNNNNLKNNSYNKISNNPELLSQPQESSYSNQNNQEQRNFNNQSRNNRNNNQTNPKINYQNNNNDYNTPVQQDQTYSNQNNISANNYNNYNNFSSRNYNSQQRTNRINWNSGDQCFAPHPNDNRLYPAVIQNINYSANLCVVNFLGYNEYYELYLNDLVIDPNNQYNNKSYSNNQNYGNPNQQDIRSAPNRRY